MATRHFTKDFPVRHSGNGIERDHLAARVALEHSNHDLGPDAQIAADVGYESESAFNRAFKREYGLPPATYRKKKASELNERPV